MINVQILNATGEIMKQAEWQAKHSGELGGEITVNRVGKCFSKKQSLIDEREIDEYGQDERDD